jgi:hypothetical protein
MPGAIKVKSARFMQLTPWEFLGGESLTMDGTPQALTIPSTASVLVIGAESAAVYYAVNGPLAGVNSPGYVPEDQVRPEGPLSNLQSCTVFGTAADAAVAHISYYREAP